MDKTIRTEFRIAAKQFFECLERAPLQLYLYEIPQAQYRVDFTLERRSPPDVELNAASMLQAIRNLAWYTVSSQSDIDYIKTKLKKKFSWRCFKNLIDFSARVFVSFRLWQGKGRLMHLVYWPPNMPSCYDGLVSEFNGIYIRCLVDYDIMHDSQRVTVDVLVSKIAYK